MISSAINFGEIYVLEWGQIMIIYRRRRRVVLLLRRRRRHVHPK